MRILELGDFPKVTQLVIGGRAFKPNSTCFQSLPSSRFTILLFWEDTPGHSAFIAGVGWRVAIGPSRSGVAGQRQLEKP